MRRITYTPWTDEDFGLTAEDLLRALSDFFLDSGFLQMGPLTLDDLKEALEQTLPDELKEALAQMTPEERERLLDRLAQKLEDEGYATRSGDDRKVEIQVTDKAIDFLGFKSLQDLMGALGKSSFGAHDTRYSRVRSARPTADSVWLPATSLRAARPRYAESRPR